MNFDEMKKEMETLEQQYAELKLAYDILEKKHKKLEERYWDSQRLISYYDRDIKHLNKLRSFWKRRYSEACDELVASDNTILENIRLRNSLTIERIRTRSAEAYMKAYQDLYIQEVKKNIAIKKGE
jgi:DNA-directed RNA polymerase subunit F